MSWRWSSRRDSARSLGATVANNLLEQRRAQMFPKLTPAQLARLERRGSALQTSAGEILVELGAPPRGVFVVAAGSVEALAPPSATQPASGYELLYLLGPGDFTGEMGHLARHPCPGARSRARGPAPFY